LLASGGTLTFFSSLRERETLTQLVIWEAC